LPEAPPFESPPPVVLCCLGGLGAVVFFFLPQCVLSDYVLGKGKSTSARERRDPVLAPACPALPCLAMWGPLPAVRQDRSIGGNKRTSPPHVDLGGSVDISVSAARQIGWIFLLLALFLALFLHSTTRLLNSLPLYRLAYLPTKMKVTSLDTLPVAYISHDSSVEKKVLLKMGEVPNVAQLAVATLKPGEQATKHNHKDMTESKDLIQRRQRGQNPPCCAVALRSSVHAGRKHALNSKNSCY